MNEDERLPDRLDVMDVSGQHLSRLLAADDPELVAHVERMVALLRAPREGTLAGWNSFLDTHRD